MGLRICLTKTPALGDEVAAPRAAPFSFDGAHYQIKDLDGQPKPVQQPHPPFLIGGGGRKTLELAGREAQIVGLAPRILKGQRADPRSITVQATAEKISRVRGAAGDRSDSLTFTDHARAEVRELAGRLLRDRGVEVTEDELLDSPHIFVGSMAGLAEKVERLRDELGISSFMVGEMGPLDPLVERLAGR